MLKYEDTPPVKSAAAEIPRYHIEVLNRGLCSGFLPLTFVKQGEQMKTLVSTEDYLPLMVHRRTKEKSRWLCCAQEMLSTLEKLLVAVRENEEHLIFIHQYKLSADTVFVHSKKPMVKLYYQSLDRKAVLDEARRDAGGEQNQEENQVQDQRWSQTQNSLTAQFTSLLLELEQGESDKEWIFYSQHIRREIEKNNLGFQSLLKLVSRLKEEASGIQWGGEAPED